MTPCRSSVNYHRGIDGIRWSGKAIRRTSEKTRHPDESVHRKPFKFDGHRNHEASFVRWSVTLTQCFHGESSLRYVRLRYTVCNVITNDHVVTLQLTERYNGTTVIVWAKYDHLVRSLQGVWGEDDHPPREFIIFLSLFRSRGSLGTCGVLSSSL
jgi:hypothetical protein